MFCPKCATQNMDGARFCRACGADISLVPQAMNGRLPEAQATNSEAIDQPGDSRRRRRHRRERTDAPNMEKGIKNVFMGIAFLFVTLVLAFTPMGRGWWFWMFIPAFTMLGGGIAELARLKHAPGLGQSSAPLTSAMPPAPHASELPPRQTSELMPPPPSVTEGTTRHLATPRGKREKNA